MAGPLDNQGTPGAGSSSCFKRPADSWLATPTVNHGNLQHPLWLKLASSLRLEPFQTGLCNTHMAAVRLLLAVNKFDNRQTQMQHSCTQAALCMSKAQLPVRC